MRSLSSLIAFVIVMFLINASTYTLPEHQQAILLQLGKVKGDPVVEPGLKFKLPFIQEVKYFDKRILQWDGVRGEIPTKDKKFIWVDTTARWRIANALAFYKAVRDIPNALPLMGSIIDGATKDIVSNNDLIESVRNSNSIFKDIEENKSEAKKRLEEQENSDSDNVIIEELISDVKPVKSGREKLSEMIATRARTKLRQDYGIELIDVQLRSIAYQENVEKKVFQSMISERKQIATKIRSAGKGEEAKILGQLDLALKKIESEAYRQSQALIGTAEAEAIGIFASSLKRDPNFYEFIKNLDAYKNTIAKKGEFILSTDSAFLELLKKGG